VTRRGWEVGTSACTTPAGTEAGSHLAGYQDAQPARSILHTVSVSVSVSLSVTITRARARGSRAVP